MCSTIGARCLCKGGCLDETVERTGWSNGPWPGLRHGHRMAFRRMLGLAYWAAAVGHRAVAPGRADAREQRPCLQRAGHSCSRGLEADPTTTQACPPERYQPALVRLHLERREARGEDAHVLLKPQVADLGREWGVGAGQWVNPMGRWHMALHMQQSNLLKYDSARSPPFCAVPFGPKVAAPACFHVQVQQVSG